MPTIASALRGWWRVNRPRLGFWRSVRALAWEAKEFARDSMPSRLRARYGDIDYDWNYRVETTCSNDGWRLRLLGSLVGAAYQPCDPGLFHETMEMIGDVRGYTFIDIGSGKGRALLMASDYPFARILGVELLPELHAVAQRNLAQYSSEKQQCRQMESVCQDARAYQFPGEPLVVFLFNPLPELALSQVIAHLDKSLASAPRRAFIVYHNPVLEYVLSRNPRWQRLGGNVQWALYRTKSSVLSPQS